MRLLFSPDSEALTSYCLAELRAMTVNFPEQRAFFIVPEQNKVQMERAYLEKTDTSGLMMAEVISFRRLAHRLLDETGLLPRQSIDAFGRQMLLFRVLKENSARLHSFGHLAERSGFLQEVDAVVGDLKRHSITSAQLFEAASAASEAKAEKSLSNKFLDLAVLLQGYNEALTSRQIADSDDDLERLAELLESMAAAASRDSTALPFPYNRLQYLSKSSVYVTGFGFTRDFTPQEYRVLAGLQRLGVNLNVGVQADAFPTTAQAIEAGPEAFLIGRRTLAHFKQRFPESETQQIKPELSRLQTAIAVLTADASGSHSPANQTEAPESEGLTFIQLPGKEAEVDYVAGEIRRLTQTKGYRFKDIAIALCDAHTQLPLLRTAARRYDLALFLDETRSLAGTSLLRYLLGLLDLPLRNWARDPLMTVLRSGLIPLESTAIDLLENDLLARGLFRRDRLFSKRVLTEPQADDPAAQRIHQAVTTIFAPIRAFTDKLNKAGTTAECCNLIRSFFNEQGITARVENEAEKLRVSGEADSALLLVSAYSVLGDVLEQLETITGNLPISLTDLRDTLRSGLSNANVTLIPSALDQVVVGDWRRVSQLPCQVIFVLGACQNMFPSKGSPEGLLKDLDRQFLSDQLSVSLPSIARDHVFADTAHLHQLLTRPKQLLYIGTSGGEPAEIVQQLKAAFPGNKTIEADDAADFSDPRLNSRAAAWHSLLRLNGLNQNLNPATAAAWRTLARSLSVCTGDGNFNPLNQSLLPSGVDFGSGALLAFQPAKHAASASLSPVAAAGEEISTEILTGIYSDTPALSVSQLEKYAACPFSHLAAYILKLRERSEYAPQHTDTGRILHGVAELALADLTARLTTAGSDSEAIKAALADFCAQDVTQLTQNLMVDVIERESMEALNDAGIKADVGRRLQRISADSLQAIMAQLQPEGFLPQKVEWKFGPNQPDKFALELADGQELQLRGVVDRVDVHLQNEQAEFKVVDYKSGDVKVNFETLYYGLALQLPAYLAAYSASHPGVMPADAAYFRFDRPMLKDSGALLEPAALEKKLAGTFKLRGLALDSVVLQLLLEHTSEKLAGLARTLFAGCFPVAPVRVRSAKPACTYCKFSAVCGFNRRDFIDLRALSQISGADGESGKKALSRILTNKAAASNQVSSESGSMSTEGSNTDGTSDTNT